MAGTKVFISYAHEDEKWMKVLRKHLGWLVNSGQIDCFDDSQIMVGDEWEPMIKEKLESAEIIVLIVSPSFLASKYCTTQELRLAMERHKKGNAYIVGVLACQCHWEPLPISTLQMLPKYGTDLKPLEKWRGEAGVNEACTQMAKQISKLIDGDGKGRDVTWPAPTASEGQGTSTIIAIPFVGFEKGGQSALPPHNQGRPADPVRDLSRQDAQALGPQMTFRDRLKSGGEGPTMIVIPAGGFLMGSPEEEKGRSSREGPQRWVKFAKAFAMGRDIVTFDEYDRFARATGKPLADDMGWGRDDRPAIMLDWYDASAYAHWLSQQTGKRYRLPTEAEWEYSARAGTGTAYWWGDEFDASLAHCASGLFAKNWFWFFRGKTTPVGFFPPNPWGLRDTSGNVMEWTADCWHGNYEDAPNDGSAWDTDGNCNQRMIRGGSWRYVSNNVRSASRFYLPLNYRSHTLGFRLARDL